MENSNSIPAIVDVALADMCQQQEWLELHKDTAPNWLVNEAKHDLTTAIKRLNEVLNNL